ncbi:hypothetical protein H920_12056 [Fukomys damarensis]|uniref:Uncharacterized protein n=1 Tax=Fukomys damarensis TaxID=885580 RepID=A0A091D8G0_FUKDA|nr:hypothetical protein H920_12056 [Fukomys damarensis]
MPLKSLSRRKITSASMKIHEGQQPDVFHRTRVKSSIILRSSIDRKTSATSRVMKPPVPDLDCSFKNLLEFVLEDLRIAFSDWYQVQGFGARILDLHD